MRRQLDGLESETERALACGYSANLVVHAFAQTARRSGFGTELTRPFFSSMRADINPATYDQTRFEEYIYGSAEVVGLMCLHAFLVHEPQAATTYRRLDPGRATWALRSRRSTSCATYPPTSRSWAAVTSPASTRPG